MRCPNCNEKVLDNVNFCHNCGFNLKEYRENLEKKEDDISENDTPKDTVEDSKKDYTYSEDIFNIFNIEKDENKEKEDEKAKEIIESNKSSSRPKRIEDIFQVINKKKNKYGNFDPDDKVNEKIENHNKETIEEPEDYNNTIFITKGYEDAQEKIKRDESIEFTSSNEFTIHKREDEEDEGVEDFVALISTKSKILFDKLNLFFTRILSKLLSKAKSYQAISKALLVVLTSLPLLLFYLNATNNWTFFQKIRALAFILIVGIIDVIQKLLSYNIGLKLASNKLYQPLDKKLNNQIVMILAVSESILLSIFAVITVGGLAGFASSAMTSTFLGAHGIFYVIMTIVLILEAVIILIDRFDYKNFWKIYGLNAMGIIVTRLIAFMIMMTFFQKIFFRLAPGLI